MSAITEKIELLGKGIYQNIPNELTLSSIPTVSELDYVGSEDFESTMLEKILPQAVTEKINFKDLLEIDFQWLCRCLRILNYGPYYTTNAVFCGECGSTSYGEYQVNLNAIECKPLPEGFKNDMIISRDKFIDFDKDIHIKLPTIQDMMNAYKDKAFQTASGKVNRSLARICYMIKSIGGKDTLTPVEIKLALLHDLSPADYVLLKNEVESLSDYGLRAGGSIQCPKCGNTNAAFIALVDDRFFKPTVGDLRRWKHDRNKRSEENTATDSSTNV